MRGWDVIRSVVLRRAQALQQPASVGEVAFAVAAYFALNLFLDWRELASHTGPLMFDYAQLPLLLSLLAVLAWFSWILARAGAQVSASNRGIAELETEQERNDARQPLSASAIFVTVLGAGLLLLIVDDVWQSLAAPYGVARYAVLAWACLALSWFCWRSLRAAGVWPLTTGLASLCACLPILALLVLNWRYPTENFFYQQVAPLLPSQVLASEETQTAQASILQEKLLALKPQRRGLADVYFLSFAPDAAEDVFLRETTAIQSLMHARFDTGARSLFLVNHATTYQSQIAATVSNLRKSVHAISRNMQSDEDVLVLYLTGHGSPLHDLVARADTMQLQSLRAETLNQILNEAGIRYAVIAVSACYSGGWVAPLATPDRLVMTASAKNRTSFGCGNESAFTYWGRAVFDEGLRSGLGFEQAFAAALPILRQRESQAGHPWSDPQIAVGAKIRPVLESVQSHWSSRNSVVIPVSESTAPRRM